MCATSPPERASPFPARLMMTDEPTDFCPTCRTQVAPRDFSTHYFVVSKCRKCGSVVESSERFGYTDADAIIAEDVAGIDSWLSTVAEGKGVRVTAQKPSDGNRSYTWDVHGLAVDW